MANKDNNIKLIECPRDAMQGIEEFIPTDKKAEYINSLLKVGFDTIDFGSFVSPKWIPQLKDTAEVLSKLDLENTDTDLLAIVANLRGAKDACQFPEIKYLGFPFSISETFQKNNINATIKESLGRVEDIQIVLSICEQFDKELIVYISMAFGNPYGDPWSTEYIFQWTKILSDMGVKKIALSDTVGMSNPDSIKVVFSTLIRDFPHIEFGAHFHTTPDTWEEKVRAAYESGCRRFDGAIKGMGGCPMSGYDLVGNMAMENLFSYFNEINEIDGIDKKSFWNSMQLAKDVFPG